MSRSYILLVVALVFTMTIFGCRRDRQPDPMPEAEAQAEAEAVETPAPAPQPTVPMCGSWVVVVESPTVAGGLDANRLLNSMLEGLRSVGCEAHTTRPSGIPSGTEVLQIAPRAQSTGGGAANLSAIVTNTSTGQLHSRHQEPVPSGDGTSEARKLGESIGRSLVR